LANGKTKLILAQRLPQFHRAKVKLEQNHGDQCAQHSHTLVNREAFDSVLKASPEALFSGGLFRAHNSDIGASG